MDKRLRKYRKACDSDLHFATSLAAEAADIFKRIEFEKGNYLCSGYVVREDEEGDGYMVTLLDHEESDIIVEMLSQRLEDT